jgi:hypothetical protein
VNNIYPVYFTCSNHFNELLCSIKSLDGVKTKNIGNIQIYCDLTDFFNNQQLLELEKYGCVVNKTITPISWGGTCTVENELLAFSKISKQIDSEDYIMNVDSDLIFLQGNIFSKISMCKEDLIGQPVIFDFHASWNKDINSGNVKFHQGSCYFIKSSFVMSIYFLIFD